MSKIKPDVYQTWSGAKVKLWNWLESEIGNCNGSFEINQSQLAEKLGVCRKTIQNALKTFIKSNLLEKTEEGRGRGKHSLYELKWTFREKNATPSRGGSNTPRKELTKGRQWRYFAYKFRTAVENSSLKKKSSVVVGKILNTLRGKSPEAFQSWLTHLKYWLDGAPKKKSLTDFFVFFNKGLMEILRSKLRDQKAKQRRQQERREREKRKSEYQEDPPPKSSDYECFADYLRAMANWEPAAT